MTDPTYCKCSTIIPLSGGRCGNCGNPINPVRRAFNTADIVTDIEQLPAMATTMTPEQFADWLAGPGNLWLVHLPGRKVFPIKVPQEHHAFFTEMLTQLRIQLGQEVQAQTAQPVHTGGDVHGWQTTPQRPAVPNGPNITTAYLPGDEPSRDLGPLPAGATSPPCSRHTCAGAGHPPKPGSIYYSRGTCTVCGGQYALNSNGSIRLHRGP